jgi:hypothetical protein
MKLPRCMTRWSGACLLLGCAGAVAQDLGPDGRRWYEVEVVVFTHESLATQVSERPLADPTRLAWLPRLRELQPASSSLAFDFEPVVAMPEALPGPLSGAAPPGALPAASAQSPLSASAALLPQAPEPVFGPLPAPPTSRGFRLAASSRDPFIALAPQAALLAQDARLLENAAEHRVLWHNTWRQPMLPGGQAAAVLVMGGEQYGDRHELEGSLRFSDSGGRVELDAHLWFSSFLAGFASEGTAWTLPALPQELVDEQQEATVGEEIAEGTAAGAWISSGAWQLRDSRLLTTETYHYFDNPAVGVLVQLRPYTVPPRDLPGTEADF